MQSALFCSLCWFSNVDGHERFFICSCCSFVCLLVVSVVVVVTARVLQNCLTSMKFPQLFHSTKSRDEIAFQFSDYFYCISFSNRFEWQGFEIYYLSENNWVGIINIIITFYNNHHYHHCDHYCHSIIWLAECNSIGCSGAKAARREQFWRLVFQMTRVAHFISSYCLEICSWPSLKVKVISYLRENIEERNKAQWIKVRRKKEDKQLQLLVVFLLFTILFTLL